MYKITLVNLYSSRYFVAWPGIMAVWVRTGFERPLARWINNEQSWRSASKHSEREKMASRTQGKAQPVKKERKADQKLQAIQAAIGVIEKSCGKGAVMRLTDRPEHKFEVIPSGSLALDMAMGVGGFPKGRIVELYGPESSGKTTLALHAIASAQKAGGYAVLIDAEHAYDPSYGKNLGVDDERLYISQPDYGEQGLNIADSLIASLTMESI